MRMFWTLALALLFTQGVVYSQTIRGTVTDARNGVPLPGANVVLEPGGKGAAADRSGNFSIVGAAPGEYTLKTTYIGYGTDERTVTVNGDALRFDIALQSAPMPGPEIVISASRALERYSPATFADLHQRDLDEQYFVQDVPVLLSDLPSINYYSESGNGIGYNYLRLRGFDQRRLAIMVNGIPQNDPEDHNVYWIDLVDLMANAENIQVQRGAGSAFYGPPAIGGSINITTGDFANRKGVSVSLGAGSYNTQRYALALGSGLIDSRYVLFGRISRITSDGYRDRAGMKGLSYYFAATRYDESFTTRLNVYGGPLRDGLAYNGIARFAVKDRGLRRQNLSYFETDGQSYSYTVERRPQEHEEFNQPHVELLNEWHPSGQLSLNSALFAVFGEGYFDYDATGWTTRESFRMTPEYGFPDGTPDPANPIVRGQVSKWQVGWMPRMTYAHDAGTLTAGLEVRTHESFNWGRIQWAGNLPEGLDPDRHFYEFRGAKQIASAYVQEQYQLSPRLNLMGNLQYVFNRYRLFDEAFLGNEFTSSYNFVNPRLGANYNFGPEWNAYANVSYTTREPRLMDLYDAAFSFAGETPRFSQRPDGSYNFSDPLVTPEKLLNVELGTGNTGRFHKILLNAYVMDFRDEIVESGQLNQFGQPIKGNADNTLHLGLELSASITPIHNLSLDVNGLLSHARLRHHTEFVSGEDGTAEAVPLDGNRIAGVPEQMANVSVTWRAHGLNASLIWKFVGSQYTDNFQLEEHRVEAYSVLNAAVGYTTPPLLGLRTVHLRLQVNNLLDELYAQAGSGAEYFVAAERNVFVDATFEL